ncbi:MAG: 5'-methylthioadenosine/S-adenosylhomocysteine nucleosidase [Deltaproteobacteria bacterium]|nr:5'-methylthioadenosine/S-adenosylhomocysteine nucleosidase [Deltaproteobacteria bacterium]
MLHSLRIASVVLLVVVLPGDVFAEAAPAGGPRIAVAAAMDDELQPVLSKAQVERTEIAAGTTFSLGSIHGKPVVLFVTGTSIPNAAATVQLAIDRYRVNSLVMTGIAGGIGNDVNIGDVVVCEQWIEFQENVLARGSGDGFSLPPWAASTLPPFREAHIRGVRVPGVEGRVQWFAADSAMFAAAKSIKPEMAKCSSILRCAPHPPAYRAGGKCGSSQSFVDNAEWRTYLRDKVGLRLVDMESAAVMHVLLRNKVPGIVFRAVSDLAGGGPGKNEAGAFMGLAAENSAKAVLEFLKTFK